MTRMHATAWYEDVRQLWARPGEFFPGAHQTDEARLNALVRLVGYCALGAALVSGKATYVLAGLLAVAVLSVAHWDGRGDPKGWEEGWSDGGEGGEGYDGYAGVPPRSVQPRQERCTRPTYDNPFMNATLGSLIKNPGRPPACKYDDVATEVWKGFDQGLFKGVEDVYDTGNSQRQFYTMPVTTAAPDTIAFANFCYGNRRTCKESPELCKPRVF